MATQMPPLILLVEDELAHAELIRRAFENDDSPADLLVVRTLQAARQRLVEVKPDLLIVDFLLPDGKGTDLLPSEKERGDYPVVIMTSHGDEETAVQAMKGGALDYVVKSERMLLAIPRVVQRALREWDYITAKKIADQEIRLLSAAVEQTAECIIITDVHDKILYVNSAFEQVTGYQRAETIGRTPTLLRSGQHDLAFYRDLWATIAAGQVWRGVFINKKKDGTLYTAEATITPVRDDMGQITHFVSAQRDVTHELKLEEQLRQSQKMEAIGQLAGGMAHDFNNILQAILGHAHLAKRGLAVESPNQVDLEQVIKATERAAVLVRQLLAFSRREPIQPRPLVLSEVVNDLLKMLQRLIGEHISLEVRSSDNHSTIYADSGQIEQILINLCVNARDAMPEGGRITITIENDCFDPDLAKMYPWAREGEYVILSVADTGTGISSHIKERIFEPFFTTKEAGKGTGLGLATAYAITNQHDGGITVHSEPGRGTTFRVYFPAASKHIPLSAAKEQPQPREQLQENGTILLAEDDVAVRQLAFTVLNEAGYQVLQAADGDEAIDLFEQYQDTIDLILVDVVMPGKSGRAIYEYVHQHGAKLPVVFSTGYDYDMLNSIDLPPDKLHLIKKPYTPYGLLQTVREILNSVTAEG